MKKYLNIRIIFNFLILFSLPFSLNGFEKIKPVFPFESLLNKKIYLNKLFPSKVKKKKRVNSSFEFADSKNLYLRIYNQKDFVEFNSKFKNKSSINKFKIKISEFHLFINNFHWKNKAHLNILNPGFSYSKRSNFYEVNSSYQYYNNFDFHTLDFFMRKNSLEFPLSVSASKSIYFNTGIRFDRKNDNKILIIGLNFSNLEEKIFPYLLFSFEKDGRRFFTSEISLIQDFYPIKSYFQEKALLWKSYNPDKFTNSILIKKMRIQYDWQNNRIESKLKAVIYSKKEYWNYFWEDKSFYIGTENEKIYTADLFYSLKQNNVIFKVKYHFGKLTDFDNESKISINKNFFFLNKETKMEFSWINNLKINNHKFSYPQFKIKVYFKNFYSHIKYTFINNKNFPIQNNISLLLGVNI